MLNAKYVKSLSLIWGRTIVPRQILGQLEKSVIKHIRLYINVLDLLSLYPPSS